MTFHRITAEEADAAYDAWGCNCGPSALAAIMGMRLDDVRPHLLGFDQKHYTNPTMMFEALASIGRPWVRIGKSWPQYGLARIQWEGPWTGPNVPMRARYRYTHWVGSRRDPFGSHGVFDVNAMGNGTGWASFEDWSTILVPHIIAHVPRADGKWHITHGIEVQTPEPSERSALLAARPRVT